jgi:uncharacterized small protein (DUF1192 family)
MRDDDIDRAGKKVVHEIGQDLSLLSVAELDDRMEALREEIERLRLARQAKEAARGAADAFFRRS